MKRMLLAFLCFLGCLAGVSSACGQVSVDIVMGQEQVLRNESLLLKVRVTNRSGQTLELGQDQEWLSFTVTKRDGTVAARLGKVPVAQPFALPSSQSRERVVDLMPYYDLEPGRYRVVATVNIRAWNSRFPSKAKTFEVVKGVKIWEQTVGIPQSEATQSPPELRRYVLLQARYLKHMYLYARITGPTDNTVVRVFPLGEIVNFVPVEHQVDRQSQLHVLFQDGARSFNYSVVDPGGRLIKRQRYDYFQSRPSLEADEDGRVGVLGGIRRLVATDFPAAPRSEKIDEVQEPTP